MKPRLNNNHIIFIFFKGSYFEYGTSNWLTMINFHLHQYNSSLMIMSGMWAICCQSWPLPNWQQHSSKEHMSTDRWEREFGSLSFVKYWSFGQSEICKFSSEIRRWRPASVKDSSSWQPLMDNDLREVRCWSPSSPRDRSLEQLLMDNVVREVRCWSPSSPKDWNSGHLPMSSLRGR